MDTGGYMWNWPQVQLSLLVNWALVAKFVWNIKTQKQTHNKPKKNSTYKQTAYNFCVHKIFT